MAQKRRSVIQLIIINRLAFTLGSALGTILILHPQWVGEGGTPKAEESTDKLCECVSDKGEWVKNSKFFMDLICELSPG